MSKKDDNVVELTKKGEIKKTATSNKVKQQLLELTLEYRNDLAREKLRKIRLINDHQEVDLSKKTGEICYIAIALQEFQNAISSVYSQIKNADERLCDLLKLDMKQSELLHNFMNDILDNLADIDVQLSPTDVFDSANNKAGTARKSELLKVD